MRRITLVVLLALLFVPAAAAHADYYRSEPARGARLGTVPSVVSVTLSEAIDPRGSSLEVRDQSGARVDAGNVRYQGGATPTLSVDLRDGLGPGAYQATWKALSTVDGHVTDGTFGFAVGGFEPPADLAEGSPYDPMSAAARAVSYAGFALGIGTIGFAMFVEPRPLAAPRKRFFARIIAAAGSLVFVGILGLFLHTANLTGQGLGGFVATGVGREFAVRLGMAALTCAVGLFGLRDALLLRTMGSLFVLDAVGNSRFAHSAYDGWWASAIDALHLVSVSLWLGGLVLFLHFIVLMSRSGSYDAVVEVGRRFSTLALTSVILAGLTGLTSTFLILGPHVFLNPLAIWTHPYGSLLALKVTLFGVMIALAGVNRFIFLGERPGPDRVAPFPQRIFDALFPTLHNRGAAFARAVGSEATLGLAVLVVAGFLTAVSPPIEGAADQPAGFQAVGLGQHHNVTLRISPDPMVGRSSNVSLLVEESATGEPVDDAIRIRVTIAAAGGNGTGGETHVARRVGGGAWTIGDVLFAGAGPHEARIEIQTEEVYSDMVVIAFAVGSSGGSTPTQ